jgi:signal transduction histidine kinase
MIELSLTARTEREILHDYERQRRFALLRAMTPAFILIATLVLVVIGVALVLLPVTGLARNGMIATIILLAGTDVVLIAGLLALRRGWLNLATGLVAGISAITAAMSLAIWGSSVGIDLFAMIELTPFSIVVVMAGLVGSRWAIIWATLLMNVATVALLFVLMPTVSVAPLWYQERPLILAVSLIYQWLFTVIMIVIWRTFARTLIEIGTAYERAKQLESLKDAFISSVNHELRTPLMTMLTYMETLRERPNALPTAQLVSVLEHVCEVGENLSDLVKSILSARHIDQDAVHFTAKEVLVRPVVETAIRLVDAPRMGTDRVPVQQRDLHVSVPETLQVWCDPIRLQQILTNLFSNALKYSNPGTPIEMRARNVTITTPLEEWESDEPIQLSESSGNISQRSARKGGMSRGWRRGAPTLSMVEFVVRDYGEGIPPDQIPLLFNRFVRLPRDLASSISGNGLGLYLCRLYTEAMGGRIWVKSSGVEGEGSIFYLLLPADAATAALRQQSNQQSATAATATTTITASPATQQVVA